MWVMNVLYQDTTERLEKTKKDVRTDRYWRRDLNRTLPECKSDAITKCQHAVKQNVLTRNYAQKTIQYKTYYRIHSNYMPWQRLLFLFSHVWQWMCQRCFGETSCTYPQNISAPKNIGRARNYVTSKDVNAWTGTEGSRRLGSQNSRHSAHEGNNVANPTHRPPLPSGDSSGAHFCYSLSQRQDRRDKSMKNPNDPIGNRSRYLPDGSGVPQPTAPPWASVQ